MVLMEESLKFQLLNSIKEWASKKKRVLINKSESIAKKTISIRVSEDYHCLELEQSSNKEEPNMINSRSRLAACEISTKRVQPSKKST